MKAMIVAALILASTVHAQEAPKRSALGTPSGRFVLGQIGEYASSQYLLDTQTGRVWEVVNMTDAKGANTGSGLRQVKFITSDGAIWGPEPPPPSK